MRAVSAALDMEYAMCRLSPLTHSGGSGLNDGSIGNKLIVECRMFCDLTIGTSLGFCIMIVPWSPYSVLIKPNGTAAGVQMTVDGVAISQGVNGNNPNFGWIPACITQGVNQANVGVLAGGIMTAGAQMRLVSQSWKLIPTSTANSISGLITVSSSSIGLTNQGENNNIVTTSAYSDDSTVLFTNAAQSVTSYYANFFSPMSQAPAGTTMKCRPESVCHGVLRHKSKTYAYQDIEQSTVLVTSSNGTFANFIGGAPISSTNPGLNFYDKDWESIIILGTTQTAGNSFQLEVSQCFEIEVSMGSPFVPFAKQPGRNNEVTAKLCDEYLSTAPVMLSGQESHFKNFLNFVSGAAPLIGSALGPIGATVGGLAGSLAKLLL